LKAFFAVLLYMGIKHQLNQKSYWHKKGFVFYCPIIRQKGSYFPSHQYAPITTKVGMKVWCLIDSKSNFVSNFEIYCRKAIVVEGVPTNEKNRVYISS